MHDPIIDALVPVVIEQSNRGERSFDIFFQAAQRADRFRNRSGRRWYGLDHYRTAVVSGVGKSKERHLSLH